MFKLSEYVNVPVMMQVIGIVLLALVWWKGIHGFLPSFGLIAGVLLVWIGRHFNTFYNTASRS